VEYLLDIHKKMQHHREDH